MAASGYTPISLYYSTTASAVPTAGNLANGELALNIADMKLYAKNSAGTVTLLASNASTTGVDSLSFGSTGLTPSTATTGAITVAGTLATTNGGTGLTSFTSGGVVYASSTSALTTGSALTFDGSSLSIVGGNATINKSTNTSVLTMGGSPSANWEGDIRFLTSNTQTNWRISSNQVTAGSFTITPSTTGGGSTFTTPALIVNSSSNVGIGTTSPSNKLVVSNAGANGLEFNPTNGQIVTYNRSTSAYSALTLLGLSFTVQTGASPADRLTVDSSGNVGIGTGSPAAKLDIYQSSVRYVRAYPSSGLADFEVVTNNNVQPVFAVKGTGTADLIRAYAGATQAMTLDASARLLVGTTSAIYTNSKIQVTSASGPSLGAQVTSSSEYAGGFWNTSSTGNLVAFYTGALGTQIGSITGTSTTLNINGPTAGSGIAIDNSGNLLVGTTATAAAKLTIVSTTNPALTLPNIAEIATVSATAATGTINYDLTTQSVLYYTTNASGNFTMNIRGNSGLSLNSMMSTGQSVTMAFLCTNGSTAYYQTAMTIDGTSVTPKWQGGTAPTSGNASSIDSYVYTIIKTGAATFTVLASQTKFA